MRILNESPSNYILVSMTETHPLIPKHDGARRAKIVCTLGPASTSPEMLSLLIEAGMDVARLNFSHGVHAEHLRSLLAVRRLSKKRGKHVSVLQDLQGPKLRTGALAKGDPVEIVQGSEVTITTCSALGNSHLITTNFLELPAAVSPGCRILLSDGLIELSVESISGCDVRCRVIEGGELRERQGINLPNIPLKISALTKKDRRDLEFAIEHNVDYIALSFVRQAADVLELKRLIKRKGKNIPVVAKLEKPEAVENLDEILAVSDAVMVARGDLGVEMPPESVPLIQKHIVARANAMRIPVIIATQLLESMKVQYTPTRAEASDVANAILEGADALMLSGETASGKFPAQAVRMMSRIIAATEASSQPQIIPLHAGLAGNHNLSIQEAICKSAARMADEMNLAAIALFTQSGSTARVLSKYHPRAPIYAFAPLRETVNRIGLYWGVEAAYLPSFRTTDLLLEGAATHLLKLGKIKPGDLIAVLSGTPIGLPGTTNLLKLHRVEKPS
ncbi:MAG: pyruvate kinase [Terriglobia bacterium]